MAKFSDLFNASLNPPPEVWQKLAKLLKVGFPSPDATPDRVTQKTRKDLPHQKHQNTGTTPAADAN